MTGEQAPPSRTARASDLAWIAAAAVALAVVAQLAVVQIRGRLLHQFTWTSPDLPWMSLAGNSVIFGAAALVLWSLGRWRGRVRRLSTVVAIFAGAASLSVLLLITAIWQYASLVLALGTAAAMSRAAERSPDTLRRVVRRTRGCGRVDARLVLGHVNDQ